MSNAVFPSRIRGITWTVLRTPGFDTIEQEAPSGSAVRIAQQQNPIWKWQLMWDYLYGAWPGSNNVQAYGPANTDIDTLIGFFMARQGKFDDFLYLEPSDQLVGPGIVTTAWRGLTNYNVGFGILDSGGHWQQVTVAGLSGSSVPSFNHSGSTTTDGTVTWQDEGGSLTSIPNTAAQLQVLSDGAGHWFSPLQRTMGGLFPEDITDLNGSISVYANGALMTSGTDYTLAGPGLTLPGYSFTGLYISWISPVAWLPSFDYASTGFQIVDNNGNIQQVTTAGTSGATEPVWATSGTTTDGGVTWTFEGANAAPAGPVTATFNFYFRVTFDGDSQDFEQTMQELWTIGGGRSRNGSGYLKLVTARPSGVCAYNAGAGARLIYGLGTVQIQWPDGSPGSMLNIVMDGAGNATMEYVGGNATDNVDFGYGNVKLVSAIYMGETLGQGPVSMGTGFTLGQEIIVMEFDDTSSAIYFSGPGTRNPGSVQATLVNLSGAI